MPLLPSEGFTHVSPICWSFPYFSFGLFVPKSPGVARKARTPRGGALPVGGIGPCNLQHRLCRKLHCGTMQYSRAHYVWWFKAVYGMMMGLKAKMRCEHLKGILWTICKLVVCQECSDGQTICACMHPWSRYHMTIMMWSNLDLLLSSAWILQILKHSL